MVTVASAGAEGPQDALQLTVARRARAQSPVALQSRTAFPSSRFAVMLGAMWSAWAAGAPIANAHAALKLGVTQFDSTVGGLGGCPFAGQPKAAGNICTEELVFLCEEMGIDTGVDLDALIEVGRMAEEIVGHTLPSELVHAGSLDAFRRRAAA